MQGSHELQHTTYCSNSENNYNILSKNQIAHNLLCSKRQNFPRNNTNSLQYAGTVMTSFDHVMIPTRGNQFQTNPLEHELDDHAGNTVSSVCVTNGKDMALQRQI